jgi:DNA repair exonuclease SbcCD ATPase subunit
MSNYSEKENNSLEINSEKFQSRINYLKKFSSDLPKDSSLPILSGTEGFFKWLKKDVKVNDINELTEKIQEKMIEQNKTLLKTINEFENVYETFSILNKEYILKIIASVKSSEEANNKAVKGLNEINNSNIEINKSNKKLLEHQQNIDGLIKSQKIVLNNLQIFKSKIEKIKNLRNVDKMYESILLIEEKLNKTEKLLSFQKEKFSKLENNANMANENFDLYKIEIGKKLEGIYKNVKLEIKKNIQNEKRIIIFEEQNIESKKKLMNIESNLNTHIKVYNEFEKYNNESHKKIDVNIIDLKNAIKANESQRISKQQSIEQQILDIKSDVYNQQNIMKVQFENEVLNLNKQLNNQETLINNLYNKVKIISIGTYTLIVVLVVLIILLISGVL